jgi:hypothetical protein
LIAIIRLLDFSVGPETATMPQSKEERKAKRRLREQRKREEKKAAQQRESSTAVGPGEGSSDIRRTSSFESTQRTHSRQTSTYGHDFAWDSSTPSTEPRSTEAAIIETVRYLCPFDIGNCVFSFCFGQTLYVTMER